MEHLNQYIVIPFENDILFAWFAFWALGIFREIASPFFPVFAIYFFYLENGLYLSLNYFIILSQTVEHTIV